MTKYLLYSPYLALLSLYDKCHLQEHSNYYIHYIRSASNLQNDLHELSNLALENLSSLPIWLVISLGEESSEVLILHLSARHKDKNQRQYLASYFMGHTDHWQNDSMITIIYQILGIEYILPMIDVPAINNNIFNSVMLPNLDTLLHSWLMLKLSLQFQFKACTAMADIQNWLTLELFPPAEVNTTF